MSVTIDRRGGSGNNEIDNSAGATTDIYICVFVFPPIVSRRNISVPTVSFPFHSNNARTPPRIHFVRVHAISLYSGWNNDRIFARANPDKAKSARRITLNLFFDEKRPVLFAIRLLRDPSRSARTEIANKFWTSVDYRVARDVRSGDDIYRQSWALTG